jgi:2OG-Fe(II) oxygenase superfamily
MLRSTETINVPRFDSADTSVFEEPFPFLVATDILSEAKRGSLHRDFPKNKEAGFFPYSEEECGPAIIDLIEEATSPEIADKLGEKLGIKNLSHYPFLVTICRLLNRRHGTIHTDSKSKVATALIYLNDTWGDTSGGGCLRFLKGSDNIDDVLAPEVRPVYGNFVIFKRADNSFHGHLPFEGERRVIQIAWLTSEEEKLRKTKRGTVSRFLKGFLGGFDKRIGAGRGRNAGHLD